MKSIIWDMTPCSPLSCTTRRHIPEDDTLHNLILYLARGFPNPRLPKDFPIQILKGFPVSVCLSYFPYAPLSLVVLALYTITSFLVVQFIDFGHRTAGIVRDT
jgi:hypothetical protein